MGFHNAGKAAPALTGNGSSKNVVCGKSNTDSNTLTDRVIQATERAEDLLALRRWELSLAHRLRIARLRFEYVGLDPDEQDDLADEVADFNGVVLAFIGRAAS